MTDRRNADRRKEEEHDDRIGLRRHKLLWSKNRRIQKKYESRKLGFTWARRVRNQSGVWRISPKDLIEIQGDTRCPVILFQYHVFKNKTKFIMNRHVHDDIFAEDRTCNLELESNLQVRATWTNQSEKKIRVNEHRNTLTFRRASFTIERVIRSTWCRRNIFARTRRSASYSRVSTGRILRERYARRTETRHSASTIFRWARKWHVFTAVLRWHYLECIGETISSSVFQRKGLRMADLGNDILIRYYRSTEIRDFRFWSWRKVYADDDWSPMSRKRSSREMWYVWWYRDQS